MGGASALGILLLLDAEDARIFGVLGWLQPWVGVLNGLERMR